MIDERYRLLIEGIRSEYMDNNPFAKIISFPESEMDDEKNSFASKMKESFSIKVTLFETDRFKHLKKYDITSKFDDSEWRVLIVPTGVLFAKNMIEFRQNLLEQHSIKGIFTLKSSFFKGTAMSTSVIVLGASEEDIWLTSATSVEDVLEIFSDFPNYKRKVYFTKSLSSESFMPEFYNEEIKQINESLNKIDTKELSEIAEIILGKNVERGDFAENGIPYLRVRNVQDGKICKIDSYVSIEMAEKYAKQLLQEGDLLLSKNFGQHKIARVNFEDLPAIASNGFFIIRAYDVPEDYLYQYLTSETGKAIFDKQLSTIEHGTIISSISLKDLKKLRVPIFDEATMIDMGNIEEANSSDILKSTPLSKMKNNKSQFRESCGIAAERNIYDQFLQVGWSKDEILLESRTCSIKLNNGTEWFPDIILMDGESKLAVVEAKRDLSLIDPDVLKKLHEVIYNGDIPFIILATTGYFEIHGKDNSLIMKYSVAPSKEELLRLLNEKEEAL